MANYINGDGLLYVLKDIDSKYAKDTDLANVAKTGSYNDLIDKPNIPEGVVVDTQLNIKSDNAISNKAVTTALNGKADQTSLDEANTAIEGLQTNKIDESEVSEVGKTGNYSDLIDAPNGLSDFVNDGNFVTDALYVHTDNNYTTEEKTKLTNIENGAQVNKIESIKVNGVAQSISSKAVNLTVPTKVSDLTNDSGYLITETDPTVPSWAKQETKPTYTANEVGAIATSLIGASSGVCPLGADKLIDTQYLPSYVDDVIETYIVAGSDPLSSGWLSLTSGGTALTPEKGKIYIVIEDGEYLNRQFRWGGTVYVEITSSDMSPLTNEEIDDIIALV